MSAPASPRTAQLILYFDGANVRAEAPGKNGARDKINLPLDFAARNPELISELATRLAAIRGAERARLRDLQNANIAYVAGTHGLGFARHVWRESPEIFSARVARHMRGELGNLSVNANAKSQTKTKSRKPPEDLSGGTAFSLEDLI